VGTSDSSGSPISPRARAHGPYFKWMGDDEWLTPTYVTRCVEVLDADAALILVTTQQAYVRQGWSRGVSRLCASTRSCASEARVRR
jgi:hypothetical protein